MVWALTTKQGTACVETALCEGCWAEGYSPIDVYADVVRDSWVDVTGNDAIDICSHCGVYISEGSD